MPGVSRNAIWPRGSLRIPTMRLRVVCGLGETIETFWPRMALSSVDLPALGRPTSVTTPIFFSLSRAERGVSGGAARSFAAGGTRCPSFFFFVRRCSIIDPSLGSTTLSPLRGARDLEIVRDPSPRLRGEGAAKRRMRGSSRPLLFFDFLPFRIARHFYAVDTATVGAVDLESISVLADHRPGFRNAS